jgi:hypothetical protein
MSKSPNSGPTVFPGKNEGTVFGFTLHPPGLTALLFSFCFSILTEKPHLAGTPQDKEQADWVNLQWKQFGLDSVKTVPYNVLLSYPRMDKPNVVSYTDDLERKRTKELLPSFLVCSFQTLYVCIHTLPGLHE